MCGILFIRYLRNLHLKHRRINFNKYNNRGPDKTINKSVKNVDMNFHRLAINGEETKEILNKNGIYLLANAEIYNHKELKKEYNFNYKTTNDCHIILELYNKYNNFEDVIKKIKGEYAFILYDSNKNKYFVARDHIGIRPLFINKNRQTNTIEYGSEIKYFDNLSLNDNIYQFPKGTYYDSESDKYTKFNIIKSNYFDRYIDNVTDEKVKNSFINAIKKRIDNTEKDYGCLLSGGLDSSIVSAISSKLLKDNCKLKTFTIGTKDSPDLLAAREVAKYIDSEHHEYDFNFEKAFERLEELIFTIESYDNTTIMASMPNYLLAENIKKNTDVKVLLSGEGSDELMGGYKYFKNYNDNNLLIEETDKLCNYLSYFDVLRSDRVISNNGLECRVPFLDIDFVNNIRSIPKSKFMSNNQLEKKYFRDLFKDDNYLPKEILYRGKEAFSDSVSHKSETWYGFINKKVNEKMSDEYYNKNKNNYFPKPINKESLYFREIFNTIYPSKPDIIPYYWTQGKSNIISARDL